MCLMSMITPVIYDGRDLGHAYDEYKYKQTMSWSDIVMRKTA